MEIKITFPKKYTGILERNNGLIEWSIKMSNNLPNSIEYLLILNIYAHILVE